MTNIISLMTELDLSDEMITSTITKINIICSKYDYTVAFGDSNFCYMAGNGNGNGNGNN